MLSGGGDILNIPKVAEETAQLSLQTLFVTYSANTDGVIQLSVDQHHYEAKRIEDIVRVQESLDLFNAYARSMGYALSKKVENYIALLLQTASANDVSLSSDNTFTTALIRSGLQKLLDANYDYTDGDTFFYCSPVAYMSLLSLGDFTEAQKERR